MRLSTDDSDEKTYQEPQRRAAPQIRPRNPPLHLTDEISRQWVGQNAVATAIVNSVLMLFPAGERFFIRSVRRYLPELPAELAERVHGFFGQEGRHGQAHDRMNHVLEEQGFHIQRFLEIYQWFCFKLIEPIVPPELRISTTAACEHFTAVLADDLLRPNSMYEAFAAPMQELLMWHAAEEIEHKSVAFDVLQTLHAGYATRVAGLALAASLLGAFWMGGTLNLLMQERQKLGWARLYADAQQLGRWRRLHKKRGIIRDVFVRGIREYLRRDFHPDNNDNYHLAQQYLTRAGLPV